MDTRTKIIDAVTDSFIRDGKFLSVKEIATAAGLSEATVRKAFYDEHGCFDELAFAWDARPSYSTQYPGIVTGHHKVATFAPDRKHLAAIIKALRSYITADANTPVNLGKVI